jgi:two-component system sensor kinase FixL
MPRDATAERTVFDLFIRTTRAADGMVEVSVADSGPGLAPEVRAKLFQPFVTTKAAGIGVGLSLCRSIVEAHGGRMWIAHAAARGADFRFTLPVVEQERAAASVVEVTRA